jgi:hypothetical protein
MEMKARLLLILAILSGSFLYGVDSRNAGPPPPPLTIGQVLPKSETDANGDGAIDYVVYFDTKGVKEHEEYDYNSDGQMDDFLYFVDGIPKREEIDSDFNGKIDLWIYILEGKYVQKYEKDTNGDGIPDVTKSYGR